MYMPLFVRQGVTTFYAEITLVTEILFVTLAVVTDVSVPSGFGSVFMFVDFSFLLEGKIFYSTVIYRIALDPVEYFFLYIFKALSSTLF